MVNWRCKKCKQIFQGTLYKKKGCPVCHGKKIVVGINDLGTTYPEIAKTISKNSPIKAEEVTARSHKKLLWVCENGHEWEATVANRTLGNGCKKCNIYRITKDNLFSEIYPDLALEWHPTKNIIEPNEVSRASGQEVIWKCKNCSYEWKRTVKNRVESPGCPSCCTSGSLQEESVRNFIKEILPNELIFYNDRNLISPSELDIYIPNKNFAIEYNGLYWHSEKLGKNKNYHLDKLNKVKETGNTLFTIWEDDWVYRQDIVKEMILHRLGLSKREKIGARKLELTQLKYSDTKDFLNTYHIQGAVSASQYLGLKKNDEIVAVFLVTERKKGMFEIVRYATSKIIPGGFSKLVKYFINLNNGNIKELYSFSDNLISDGDLYAKNGFVCAKEIPADYSYIYDNERKHKFGFRLKRFKNDPMLIFKENLTESELASLNGIDRVWDAGKKKWSYKF